MRPVPGNHVMARRHRSWFRLTVSGLLTLSATLATARQIPPTPPPPAPKSSPKPAPKRTPKFPRVARSDRQWRARLDANQYLVTRRKATEPAFTGLYWNHHDDGAYACVCCGTPLFDSAAKFESGTGWPSYWRPIDRDFLRNRSDFSDGTSRVEVICRVCDAHLGHVFEDGPAPTGLRYCINSASLEFIPRHAFDKHLEQWRESVGLAPTQANPRKDAPTQTENPGPKPGVPSENQSSAPDSSSGTQKPPGQ